MTQPIREQTVLDAAQDLLPAQLKTHPLPFGPESCWRPGLVTLLDGLRDAGLGPVRTRMATSTLAGLLASRSAETHLRGNDPAAFEAAVTAPVFITGLPRTGTTLLHNLLATHPAHRGHLLWELRSPARAVLDGRESLVAETGAMIALLHELAPEFSRIHPLHPERPDECNWAFRPTFRTLVLAFQFFVPAYVDWMLSTDATDAYRNHRDQLALLGRLPPTGRPVLKDPCHLWHLDALLETFPDASVIVCQRDPKVALPSFASLCFALQSMADAQVRPEDVGALCLRLAREGMRRLAEVRRRFPGRLIDLPYAELVAQPVQTVRQLYRRLGSSDDARATARLEDWLYEDAQSRPPRHVYSLDRFGLTEEDVRDLE